MNQTSLDKQSGGAEDGHVVRIVRLETQMDHVTSILVSLQRTQEENHQAMLARFDDLRNRMDELHQIAMQRMDELHQTAMQRMDQLHQTAMQRMDQLHQTAMQRMDQLHQTAMQRMDQLHQNTGDRTDRLHQITTDRTDRYVRWMVGIMLANVTATAGILVRLALT
jgi:hypothetical protein